jgi:predicted secreted protein
MSVVNVKVAHIRPQFQDLSKWIEAPNHVYIGRRGIVFIDKKRFPQTDSIWANPFKIKANQTRLEVITQYETYIRHKLTNDAQLVQQLLELKGKILGCWCHPEPCHGDVLLKLIDEYTSSSVPNR